MTPSSIDVTREGRSSGPGRVKHITSPANPIIKAIRSLAQKKHRSETRRFIAEGMKLVVDGLDAGWQLETVICQAESANAGTMADVLARARAAGADILLANNKVLEAIARRDNPQAVLAVFAQKLEDLSVVEPSPAAFWIGLDRVRDPGNLGTIIRTADALGASGVVLIGETTDPFSLEAVRATMGSLFHTPLCHASEAAFMAWRANWPGRIIGTHLAGEIDIRDLDTGDVPTLLLMGNEQQGLSENLSAACDLLVRIPMAGKADSLNLAVSTAIASFELLSGRFPALPTEGRS